LLMPQFAFVRHQVQVMSAMSGRRFAEPMHVCSISAGL
jgi:hypothetical protein